MNHSPALVSRRSALLGLTSAVTMLGLGGRASLALAAAATEQRLVVVIQRGAMDGLAAVVPYGDPALTGLRGEVTPSGPGQNGGVLELGGFTACIRRSPACTRCMRRASCCRSMPLPGRIACQPFRGAGLQESGSDHVLSSGWLDRRGSGSWPPGPQAAKVPRWRSASPCRCSCADPPASGAGRRRVWAGPDRYLYRNRRADGAGQRHRAGGARGPARARFQRGSTGR